jgi:signal transduction histidine kinase
MASPEQPGHADRRWGRRSRPGSAPPRPARTRSIGVTLVGLLLVPVVALVALWSFLASITLGNALTEHTFNQLTAKTTASSTALLAALGEERLRTFLWLSAPKRPPVSQLAAVRRSDDAAIAAYPVTAGQTHQVQEALRRDLNRIPGIRAAADAGRLSAPAAFGAYSGLVDELYEDFVATAEPNDTLDRTTLAAVNVGRAEEQVSREATVTAAAAFTRGQLIAGDHRLFADAVTSQRLFIRDAVTLAAGRLGQSLTDLYGSAGYRQFAALEDQIAAGTAGPAAQARVLAAWGPAAQAFLGQLQAVTAASAGPLTALSGQEGNRLLLEAVLAGGLGLLAVVASLALMIRFGRSIRRDLTRLNDSAQAMATQRLPHVIERLSAGDEVDVAAESPPLAAGRITEIARVADSFSTVHRTAVDAAVGQARLRQGFSQVFLNLSLRNQSLLHRQLGMLDTMERATSDPTALADLFRVDHLTTRMRRHAEGLIILAGEAPGRGWRDPVPVLDVLRAAIAEVEDYVRVDVTGDPPDAVVGPAVNDVIHLIAELVENATAFSPPSTRVQVRADAVGVGLAVEIEDRGLGVHPEELAQINDRLARPPEFDLADSSQLGLFVVARLAARHEIRVLLRDSPYGGTTAIVLLPRSIIARDGEADLSLAGPPEPDAASRRTPGPSLSGRHRSEPPWRDAPRAPAVASAPRAGADQVRRSGVDATHRGLPRRVRQENLAPQLRGAASAPSPTPRPAADPAARSPEDTRRMMAALQDGWQRGRLDDLGDFAGEWPGGRPDVSSDDHDGEAP